MGNTPQEGANDGNAADDGLMVDQVTLTGLTSRGPSAIVLTRLISFFSDREFSL
jgi:hypothetical protein